MFMKKFQILCAVFVVLCFSIPSITFATEIAGHLTLGFQSNYMNKYNVTVKEIIDKNNTEDCARDTWSQNGDAIAWCNAKVGPSDMEFTTVIDLVEKADPNKYAIMSLPVKCDITTEFFVPVVSNCRVFGEVKYQKGSTIFPYVKRSQRNDATRYAEATISPWIS